MDKVSIYKQRGKWRNIESDNISAHLFKPKSFKVLASHRNGSLTLRVESRER